MTPRDLFHAGRGRGVALHGALAAALVLGLATLLPAQQGGAEPRFPQVRGSSLDGRSYVLPRDFEGELNLIFVAFQREQQDEVDTWLPLAQRLARERPGLRYYELPTIGRGWRLFRGVIDGGMRGGIPDPSARAATITLYLDKGTFRSSLGLPDEGRIYALLVDRAGRVRWRADGPLSPEKVASLGRALGPGAAPGE